MATGSGRRVAKRRVPSSVLKLQSGDSVFPAMPARTGAAGGGPSVLLVDMSPAELDEFFWRMILELYEGPVQ